MAQQPGGGSDVVLACRKLLPRVDPAAAPAQQQRTLYALSRADGRSRAFDVHMTDGSTAWVGTGLRPSRPAGLSEEQAWARACELLGAGGSDARGAGDARPAALDLRPQPDGSLMLIWTWERQYGGRDVLRLPGEVGRAGLQPQASPSATVAAMLEVLVDSHEATAAATRASAAAEAQLRQSLVRMRASLETQAAETKARERELYLKFTMLLNYKTRELQRMRSTLDQMSAELQRMRADEEERNTDDDEADARYQAALLAGSDEGSAQHDPGPRPGGDADRETQGHDSGEPPDGGGGDGGGDQAASAPPAPVPVPPPAAGAAAAAAPEWGQPPPSVAGAAGAGAQRPSWELSDGERQLAAAAAAAAEQARAVREQQARELEALRLQADVSTTTTGSGGGDDEPGHEAAGPTAAAAAGHDAGAATAEATAAAAAAAYGATAAAMDVDDAYIDQPSLRLPAEDVAGLRRPAATVPVDEQLSHLPHAPAAVHTASGAWQQPVGGQQPARPEQAPPVPGAEAAALSKLDAPVFARARRRR